jgi:hypothetical protein
MDSEEAAVPAGEEETLPEDAAGPPEHPAVSETQRAAQRKRDRIFFIMRGSFFLNRIGV